MKEGRADNSECHVGGEGRGGSAVDHSWCPSPSLDFIIFSFPKGLGLGLFRAGIDLISCCSDW
jgi:hypothetical protein